MTDQIDSEIVVRRYRKLNRLQSLKKKNIKSQNRKKHKFMLKVTPV